MLRSVYKKEDITVLVNLAKIGDAKALEELIRRVQENIYSIFSHLTDKKNDVSDLTQETLIKMAKNLPSLKENEHFKSWLNRIITFALVVFALIFFRANNIADAFKVVSKIFVDIRYPFMREADMFAAFVAVSILLVKEFIEEYNINFSISESRFWLVRHAYIIFMVICIILFGVLGAEQFIYFQF